MKLLKVGSAILNQTPMDWQNNTTNITNVIKAARDEGVSILCLPELCICGYGCEDMFLSPQLRRTVRQKLAEILPETKGLVVSLGMPVLTHQGLINTACVVADGKIAGFVGKRFLAREGVHYETRWFKAWPQGVSETVEFDGVKYPFGDIYFDFDGVRVGFEICEDAWAAQRPGVELARKGIDIILNPSASHFAFDKFELRKRFVLEGSRAFGVTYVYSNLVGNEAGRIIYDGGAMIASDGQMLAEGTRFTFKPFDLTTAVIDLDKTRMRRVTSGDNEARSAQQDFCIKCDFVFPEQKPAKQDLAVAKWEESEYRKEEEFTRAVSLGLFDYLRKSKSKGFIVSLSGGADSTAVVCLVSVMAQLCCNEIGLEKFTEMLGLKIKDNPAKDLMNSLLTCVYQATENSSETTLNAAKVIADAIGADFMNINVNDLVNGYTSIIEGAIGRKLNWQDDDIALQNIQARVRAPGVWMLANLRNLLLLATSNRSEAAVGYATMDGDTCGGLSPIAGIDKAFLRQWLTWMEKEGPVGIGPIPELQVVNCLTPTAELRPQSAHQTDEDDLMPYEILDTIECMAIRDKQFPSEVLEMIKVQFPQYDSQQLSVWVNRFFSLWCLNQWKRERYAPSFHVDDKNLDPKTWCRFPILSGGFSEEINQIKQLRKDD